MRKKNNKEDKNNKKRRTASKFFSNLNTSSSKNNDNHSSELVETNPKSKWVKWIFTGVILTVTTIGIAVPWSLSSCSISSKLPISDSEIMYTININGVSYQVTWKDFENRINEYQSKENNNIHELENSFIYSVLSSMYEEERNAYFKFKAVVDQKNKDQGLSEVVGNDNYGVDVSKSLNDIEKEQRKALNQAKTNIQKTAGNNWLDQWAKELATNPIYGIQNLENAKTSQLDYLENKAVQYMTTNVIKNAALARFNTFEITTKLWTKDDLSWQCNQDIKFTNDDNGKETTLTANEATNYIKEFLQENKNAVSLENPNPSDIKDLNKLAVLQTKSYIPNYRFPNETIKDLLPKYYNTGIISSFNLSFKPGEKNFTPFTFESSLLKNLFTISFNVKNPLTPSPFAPITRLWNFKGASLSIFDNNSNGKKDNALDFEMISNINPPSSSTYNEGDNSSVTSENIGATKLKTFNDLLSTSDENSTNNLINLIGITSSGSDFDNTNPNDYQLFKAKELNPLSIFIQLLFSIDNQNDLTTNLNKFKLKKYYEGIYASTSIPIPNQTLEFVKLLKRNFEYKNDKNDQIVIKNSITGWNEIHEFNGNLENILNSFSQEDNSFIGKLMAISFIDTDGAKINYLDQVNNPTEIYQLTTGYWSLYKLNNDTFLHVNNDNLKIFTKNIITTSNADLLDKMILSDLNRSVDTKTSSSLFYDVVSVTSKLNNDNIIYSYLLEDPSYKNKFQYQIFKEIWETEKYNGEIPKFDENEKYLETLKPEDKIKLGENILKYQTFIKSNLQSLLATDKIKMIESVSKSINPLLSSNKYYDFATVRVDEFDQNELYWQFENNYDPNNKNDQYLGISKISELIFDKTNKIIDPKKKIN